MQGLINELELAVQIDNLSIFKKEQLARRLQKTIGEKRVLYSRTQALIGAGDFVDYSEERLKATERKLINQIRELENYKGHFPDEYAEHEPMPLSNQEINNEYKRIREIK